MIIPGKRTLLQKIVHCSSRVYRVSTGGFWCVTQPRKALPLVPQTRPLRIASAYVSHAAAPAAGDYGRVFKRSVDEPDQLWAEAAQGITWHKPWTKTMERKEPFSTSWFVGGELNICYNALDRHIENGQGDQIAIIYDSPVTNMKEFITYNEVLEQVSKLAGVMLSHGVKKGDCVVIYMPMIPQTMYTMLACARIGAIHSLIFGGFASKELSSRIDHTKPKLVVTSTFGIEPGRKVEYVPLLEKALEMINHQPERVLIYSRPNMGAVPLKPGRHLDWNEEVAKAKPCDAIPVHSDHPLYILYTSGTTGTPKGIVRPTGGYAVMLNWTMSAIYGLKSKEVWWAASDLGWVVGHSYICYGPLLHGNTTVLYEGKPVGTPDAGAFFRVLSEYGVVALFTAPTAIRAIRQQDPEAVLGKQYNLTRFRTLFVAGERCDVDTLEWCKKIFKVPVLDHWWQTETGSPITASCIGLGNSLTPPPGQTGKLVPGYNVVILDDNKQPVKVKTLGNIVVKLPLPPGAFLGLWKNEELYKELYFQKFPGYYDTMDAGYMDEEGYLYVMSRVDDVINVAGHRISAGAIEEAILSHMAVADCAVVGQEDRLKGHVPLALCVLRNGIDIEEEQLLEEIVARVREDIGPVAAFRKVVFVKQIPKTRSGKIPRSALASLVNGKPYKITPTIEDPAVFKHVEEVLEGLK
ncbi:acyl-CoA synthetase short-chain family member 3, mitochondrial [Pseudonaja textilis]|uniref:acyl-CoA synthetase short-chain family member 3, mitochondrial n=1 Tax=Pseudonaja textilis TaxID=8673 RepID=UPI000EA83F31|nr:acyl-CoA synthetase short-chain family member 3, mitochondrial [Pseudonaja textilis]XP_026554937.1 acyl-CoA synthetase short-chain family member 3, mitochondrial [Pseudonaja textilis]XP_026554945.1 acyl-CoA synthetase short-chain family member 3, mitochondrial [Pseudonaja textilis]